MSRLDTHVSAVQRQLTLAIFAQWAAMTIFVGGVLALLLVVMEKLLLHVPVDRPWLWTGAAAGAAAIVAAAMAFLNRPTREAAAVAIDDKLGLSEKFSTALHVRKMADPFARAVVVDAERTADKVRLSGQFTPAFPRFGYWAIGAVILALVAWKAIPNDIDLFGRKEAAKKAQQQKMEYELAQQIVKETMGKIDALPPKMRDDEAVKLARADLVKALSDRHIPDSSAANRVKIDSLAKAEEAARKEVNAAKQEIIKTQQGSLMRSLNPPADAKGPVAEAQRKLVAGKYEEAIKEMEKVSKEWDKMNKDEQKEVEKQVQQMAQKLEQMAKDPRVQQQVQQQMQKAGLNQQQQQQVQQLAQQAANGNQQAAKQLQQMAQQAMQGMNQQQQQQVQQAIQQAAQAAQQQANAGAMGQAAQQMAQGMQQAQQAQANGQQQGQQQAQQQMQNAQQQMQNAIAGLQQMQQQNQQALNQAQQAQQGLQQGMQQAGGELGQGQGQGQGQGDGQGQGQQGQFGQGDPQNKPGQGQGGPGQGQGGQGGKTAAPYAIKQEVSPSAYNEKGAHIASIQVKDKSIKGDAKLQLEKVLTAGEAAESDEVDDTRADRRAQEVQRKYFQVMQDDVKK